MVSLRIGTETSDTMVTQNWCQKFVYIFQISWFWQIWFWQFLLNLPRFCNSSLCPTLVSKKTTFRSRDTNRSSKLANRPEQLRWKVLRKSAIRVIELVISWTYSRFAQSCWLFRCKASRWYCKCLLLIFARSLRPWRPKKVEKVRHNFAS